MEQLRNLRPPWWIWLALPCSAASAGISLPESLIDTTQPIVAVMRTPSSTEGPAVRRDGTLFFTSGGRIMAIAPDSAAQPSELAAGQPNGLVFDYADRLLICGKNVVQRINGDSTRSTLAAFPGSANDITLTPDGGMFFTVPVWGGFGNVYYSAGRDLNPVPVIAIDDGFPNGIEYVSERRTLWIAYTLRNVMLRCTVWADYSVAALDSFPINTPDGFAIDSLGNFWVATAAFGEIAVFDTAGNPLGTLTDSAFGSVQNCCFGGPGNHTLYIAAATGVYKVVTKMTGRDTRGGPLHAGDRRNLLSVCSSLSTSAGRSSQPYLINGRQSPTTRRLVSAVRVSTVRPVR